MKVIELFCCVAALTSLTSGVIIQCDNQISVWSRDIGFLYSCRSHVLSAENPSIITDVSGSHTEGRNNSHVKGFRAEWPSHEILTTIPRGLENFLEHLEAFAWNHGNLSTIDSNTFKPFPNLMEISLTHNRIVTLDGDLFQYTRKLVYISFFVNSLEHVGHDLLTGLNDLIEATFVSNPCISVLATTPQQIQALNLELPVRCPPLPATLYPPSTTPEPPASDPPSPDPPITTIPTTTSHSSGLYVHERLLMWSLSLLILILTIQTE